MSASDPRFFRTGAHRFRSPGRAEQASSRSASRDFRSERMKIGAPKETAPGEARVALTPESAGRLQKLGYDCLVEAGAGAAASITDAAYADAGVQVVESVAELWSQADVIIKVREPSVEEIEAAPDGKTLIGFIWPAA